MRMIIQLKRIYPKFFYVINFLLDCMDILSSQLNSMKSCHINKNQSEPKKSVRLHIILKRNNLLQVKFKLHNLGEQADSFIPAKPTIEGNCNNEDAATMKIKWPGYSLLLSFAKVNIDITDFRFLKYIHFTHFVIYLNIFITICYLFDDTYFFVYRFIIYKCN